MNSEVKQSVQLLSLVVDALIIDAPIGLNESPKIKTVRRIPASLPRVQEDSLPSLRRGSYLENGVFELETADKQSWDGAG